MVLGPGFDVLVAGSSLPPNPGEPIETDRRSANTMESLLEQAKSRYDLIVVDTPPLTAVSDAFPLLGKVDGVIIVGRVGRNRRDVAQRLRGRRGCRRAEPLLAHLPRMRGWMPRAHRL